MGGRMSCVANLGDLGGLVRIWVLVGTWGAWRDFGETGCDLVELGELWGPGAGQIRHLTDLGATRAILPKSSTL